MQLNTQKTRRLESLLIGETVPIDPNRVGFKPDRFGFRPREHTFVLRASGHGFWPWRTVVASTCAREQEQTAETEGTDAMLGTYDVAAKVVARKNGWCTLAERMHPTLNNVPNFSIRARGVRIAFEFQERLCNHTFERTVTCSRLEIRWSLNCESSPCNQKENHQGLACR